MRKRVKGERRDLVLAEYVCAFANLIYPRADKGSTLSHMIAHLANVAEDTATRGFDGPRLWSQTCMAHIATEKRSWKDVEFIATQHTRLSWLHSTHNSQGVATMRFACPDYNDEKCKEQDSHTAAQVTLVHCCSVCLALFRREHSHVGKTCSKARRIMGQPGPNYKGRHADNKSNNNNSNNAAPTKSTSQAQSKN